MPCGLINLLNAITVYNKFTALKRKFTKEERDLRGKYKLLARLMDAEEYEKFIGSIKKEKQLRQRVKELSRYRKNGITKLEGIGNETQYYYEHRHHHR